jgi:Domain of unknown function (DUF1707)
VTDTIRPYAPGASFHLGMRAADADRERAAGVLRAGFAERRLTKDEYDERISAVLAARTYGELATLTRGLPAGPLPSLSPPLKTNKTAILAMKWAVFTPFLLALIPLGIGTTLTLAAEAREEIEKTGEPGGRLALAARVIGWSMIAAFILAIVLIPHFFHGSNSGPPNPGMGQ